MDNWVNSYISKEKISSNGKMFCVGNAMVMFSWETLEQFVSFLVSSSYTVQVSLKSSLLQVSQTIPTLSLPKETDLSSLPPMSGHVFVSVCPAWRVKNKSSKRHP